MNDIHENEAVILFWSIRNFGKSDVEGNKIIPLISLFDFSEKRRSMSKYVTFGD